MMSKMFARQPLPANRAGSQDTILFGGPIRDNIRYGRGDATEEIIAASKARMRTNLSGIPDGYQTIVGEKGINLSGGQRQRRDRARDSENRASSSARRSHVRAGYRIGATGARSSGRAHGEPHHLRRRPSAEYHSTCRPYPGAEQRKIVESGTHAALLEQAEAYHYLSHITAQRTPRCNQNEVPDEQAGRRQCRCNASSPVDRPALRSAPCCPNPITLCS